MKKTMIFSGQLFKVLNTSRLRVVKFWKVVLVFAHGKKSCNSTLKFVNFKYSSGLGYCIKGVAGRKATG